MWSPRRKPAPARRWLSSCRSSNRWSTTSKTAGISAVILSPTRELAIQIQRSLYQDRPGTGIRAAVVVGGMSESTQLQAIRKGAQVVIATPGRLYDFLKRNLVNLSGVRISGAR